MRAPRNSATRLTSLHSEAFAIWAASRAAGYSRRRSRKSCWSIQNTRSPFLQGDPDAVTNAISQGLAVEQLAFDLRIQHILQRRFCKQQLQLHRGAAQATGDDSPDHVVLVQAFQRQGRSGGARQDLAIQIAALAVRHPRSELLPVAG